MPARWTVLASGSAGNASLLQSRGFGLLLDAGLGPRQLDVRFQSVGATWSHVNAVLLTHTHSDHWRRATLKAVFRRRIPLYCHAEHQRWLRENCDAFREMQAERLIRTYEAGAEFSLTAGLRCLPLQVSHDAGSTFGFRFEADGDLPGDGWALGYAADLGIWDAALVDALADVDVLALEFNHDVEMQRNSGRSEALIARVLGDGGHLSNAQAAEFLHCVVERSASRKLRHVVQLHLSRECNRPELARAAAQEALDRCRCRAEVHTASQHEPLPGVELSAARAACSASI